MSLEFLDARDEFTLQTEGKTVFYEEFTRGLSNRLSVILGFDYEEEVSEVIDGVWKVVSLESGFNNTDKQTINLRKRSRASIELTPAALSHEETTLRKEWPYESHVNVRAFLYLVPEESQKIAAIEVKAKAKAAKAAKAKAKPRNNICARY